MKTLETYEEDNRPVYIFISHFSDNRPAPLL